MTTTKDYHQILSDHLTVEPTSNQQILLKKWAEFLSHKLIKSAFILKGYAGTGKTTMLSVLIKALKKQGNKTVLLAPTGRAAKVLSAYSGEEASTIHRKIYFQKSKQGAVFFVRQRNLHKNTLFIVDEASMIGSSGGSGGSFISKSKSLLEDLIDYVFEGENCKLLLVGDVAQLPPVGLNLSPALDQDYLKASFGLNLDLVELTEVVRQKEASGVLGYATEVRKFAVESQNDHVVFDALYDDVKIINGIELEEEITHSYDTVGKENTLIITRSNKRANLFNQHIRSRILWMEEEICAGDLMMVVKNNYFWVEPEYNTFIANGDIIEIIKVNYFEERFGFRFADAIIKLQDYPNMPEIEVKLLVDTIMVEMPALSREDQFRLYEEVLNSYEHEPSRQKKRELLKKDPYYNALQVKFSYAVTCHKAQGGQWDVVFLEQGYLTEDMINQEWHRWLYTGMTRATKKLYLVNFHPRFTAEIID